MAKRVRKIEYITRYDVCYDFDGVLHFFRDGWTGEIPLGEPMKDARWAIDMLIKKNKKVIIQTTRKIVPTKRWLKKHGFPKIKVTNKKPIATRYVDDRGIRFEGNHQSIVKLII